ncbi:MAG: tRNA preQ1(34) S-adenosylmethionine ribosyltransferase-isomerase QueA [Clostridia bacterium]|nr:tRNA preQ1(34) S-adenosylmethionine ribosyltransferase-isomerase QueA [Clostridia bacterium]
MDVADFDYFLPPDRIAQTPVEPRDAARLLVLDRRSGRRCHHVFRDLPDLLAAGDLLVLNDTRVLPARLVGRKASGGRVEMLLLRRLTPEAPGEWEALARPARRLQPGTEVIFGDGQMTARILDRRGDGLVRAAFTSCGDWETALARIGQVPLPPYIRRPVADPSRYQTVYAREAGSAAAPTAGLHFTPELIGRCREVGIEVTFVTLHVGLGTFRPVQVQRVEEHRMHAERYRVPAEAAAAVAAARRRGGRVVAVGTTVVRTLETAADGDGSLRAGEGWSDLFIYPGFRFRVVDAMITNFHLPRSTLLMLVAAFAGRDLILEAYREAVAAGYRFFSFGDAMLIL